MWETNREKKKQPKENNKKKKKNGEIDREREKENLLWLEYDWVMLLAIGISFQNELLW